MRRLVALALVERVAHQLAQLLAVGRRVRFDQLRERGVAFLEQALAPAFGAVQQRGFLARGLAAGVERVADRRSEEHTSELPSLMRTSYAVFCLKKKK